MAYDAGRRTAAPLWMRVLHTKFVWVAAGVMAVLAGYLVYSARDGDYRLVDAGLDSEEVHQAEMTLHGLAEGAQQTPPAIDGFLSPDINRRAKQVVARAARRLADGTNRRITDAVWVGDFLRVRVSYETAEGSAQAAFFLVRDDGGMKITGPAP